MVVGRRLLGVMRVMRQSDWNYKGPRVLPHLESKERLEWGGVQDQVVRGIFVSC